MKKYLALYLLVLCAAIFPGTSIAAETAPTDKPEKVETFADAVVSHFPRAEGHVTFAEDRKVRLDIGSDAGLMPGMTIYLFRPGKPIIHPVTKKVLGTREEPLGSMVLAEVKGKESEGELKELLVTRIIPGDVGRLSTARSKLLVALYGKDVNETVVTRMFSELDRSSRFDLLERIEVTPTEGGLTAADAAGMAAANKSDDLLVIKTTPTKRQTRTNVDITLYASDGKVMEHREGLVDVTSEVYGENVMEHPLVRGEHRDFYHMQNIPYRGKFMAAGNIMGEGKTEVAISDGNKVIVYRIEQGTMRELWAEAGSDANQHLALDCADLDGDGKDEIYVTNFVGETFSSYVIAYDGTSFKTVYGPAPFCFRILDVPGAGKKLITSGVGSYAPYSGVLSEYRWERGTLVKAGVLELPGKIKDPYGFVLADLVPENDKKDGDPFMNLEIVWVDDSDYIQILDMKGKRLWKSKDHYGGYDSFFELDKRKFTLPNVDNRGKVKGKLTVMDGPEGGKEIILTKNIPMTYVTRRFRGYSGAEVYALAWDGKEMSPAWSIKNIDGFAADIYVGDVTNSGRQGVALLMDPTYKLDKAGRKKMPIGNVGALKNIISDNSTLLVYKMPQR